MGLRSVGVVAGALLLASCTGTSDEESAPAPTRAPISSSPTSPSATPSSSAPTRSAADRWGPVSLPALAERDIRGDRLRYGADRERTSSYTSREVSYRVRSAGRTLRVSGVLNVPRGGGPFPAVVLAHGYIDPSVYVTGQGMTRERGWLAERGYVALHVDYRNHAASDRDPANERDTRLGYVEDVVAAAQVLRRLPGVDDDRVFLMGRSMGGGVALRTLVAEPGVFAGAVAWASVSSWEPDNVAQFGIPGPERTRRFWRGVSARTFFDRVEDPVLLVQGGSDDTCPPRWARTSYRLLKQAGAPARLAWYPDEEHAFGPQFDAAMRRSVAFFERAGGA